jgi:hypothetical protein
MYGASGVRFDISTRRIRSDVDIGQMHKPLWLLLVIVISRNFVRLAVENLVQKKNDQVQHLAGIACSNLCIIHVGAWNFQ